MGNVIVNKLNNKAYTAEQDTARMTWFIKDKAGQVVWEITDEELGLPGTPWVMNDVRPRSQRKPPRKNPMNDAMKYAYDPVKYAFNPTITSNNNTNTVDQFLKDLKEAKMANLNGAALVECSGCKKATRTDGIRSERLSREYVVSDRANSKYPRNKAEYFCEACTVKEVGWKKPGKGSNRPS